VTKAEIRRFRYLNSVRVTAGLGAQEFTHITISRLGIEYLLDEIERLEDELAKYRREEK
jgi:hypothetical protein